MLINTVMTIKYFIHKEKYIQPQSHLMLLKLDCEICERKI